MSFHYDPSELFAQGQEVQAGLARQAGEIADLASGTPLALIFRIAEVTHTNAATFCEEAACATFMAGKQAKIAARNMGMDIE